MITALVVLLYAIAAYGVLVGIGFFWKPDQPTCLLGFVWGPLRLENKDGKEIYKVVPNQPFRLLFFLRPEDLFAGEGKYAITHIQYLSRFGFLLNFPGCFHFWTQPRFQQNKPNPNVNDISNPTVRVPGSEICLPYCRFPGWRESKEGYVLSGGYFGFHLD